MRSHLMVNKKWVWFCFEMFSLVKIQTKNLKCLRVIINLILLLIASLIALLKVRAYWHVELWQVETKRLSHFTMQMTVKLKNATYTTIILACTRIKPFHDISLLLLEQKSFTKGLCFYENKENHCLYLDNPQYHNDE